MLRFDRGRKTQTQTWMKRQAAVTLSTTVLDSFQQAYIITEDDNGRIPRKGENEGGVSVPRF